MGSLVNVSRSVLYLSFCLFLAEISLSASSEVNFAMFCIHKDFYFGGINSIFFPLIAISNCSCTWFIWAAAGKMMTQMRF